MSRRSSRNIRLINSRTPEEWARLISAKWQENVASIFEVANMLEAAALELGGTGFVKMYRDHLKFSKQMVSHLKKIATDEKLREVHHGVLPASWRTLYELTKLTDEQFKTGIDNGVIHAGMERKDINALRPKKIKKKDIPPPIAQNLDDWCGTFGTQIALASATLSRDEKDELFSYLSQAIAQLKRD